MLYGGETIIFVALLGMLLTLIPINDNDIFVQTKRALDRLMRVVFTSLILLGLYMSYERTNKIIKIGYDSNISVEKYRNFRGVDSLYEKMAIEELKESGVDNLIHSKQR